MCRRPNAPRLNDLLCTHLFHDSLFMMFQLPPEMLSVEPLLPLMAVACPSCHTALAVNVDLSGHTAECPLCTMVFRVPPAAANALQSPQSAPAVLEPRGELEFPEPIKCIDNGAQIIRLHRLTPEEKASRRARRNLIMLLVGLTILVALVLILGTK